VSCGHFNLVKHRSQRPRVRQPTCMWDAVAVRDVLHLTKTVAKIPVVVLSLVEHRWLNASFLTENRMAYALQHGYRYSLSPLCKLSCTIKTHKPPGSITARLIHSSVNLSLGALGEVVNRLIDPIIRQHDHICWSSEDVQRHLLNATVSSSSILMKFDVKEFYMSGEHEQHAHSVSSQFEKPLTKWVDDCVFSSSLISLWSGTKRQNHT
jgi:hypothetical protein